MCVSSNRARFEGTTLYIGEQLHPTTGNLIHVMGYQNTPVNESSGPNAMLLHFPSARPMNRENLLDTSKAKNILKDMVEVARPTTRGMFSLGVDFSPKGLVEVFDHDIYTVVIAEYPTDIPAALERVPEDRRPSINEALLRYYEEKFSSWSVALCCFNNKDAREAAPLLWWYEPENSNILMAPALDAHDGNPPNEQAMVDVDTFVVMGSYRLPSMLGSQVFYQDTLGELAGFLPRQVRGQQFRGGMSNGDFVIESRDLHTAVSPAYPKRWSPERLVEAIGK